MEVHAQEPKQIPQIEKAQPKSKAPAGTIHTILYVMIYFLIERKEVQSSTMTEDKSVKPNGIVNFM